MAGNIVAEVTSSVRRLNNLEASLERAIARAERSRNSAQLAAQARTGFFHRCEAIESLQRAVNDMADSDMETMNLVQSVVRSMQAIAGISDAIISLGAANIAQNRVVVNQLNKLLQGNEAGDLDSATQDEILNIIRQLKEKQDLFERQAKTDTRVSENEQRIDDVEERLNALAHGKIMNAKPLTPVWQVSDFEDKSDLFNKIRNGEVKKGHHFKTTVGKIIESGVFVYLANDPSSKYGRFDGFIPSFEIDWEKPDYIESLISEGEEIEVQISRIDLENEKITLSRRALLVREHENNVQSDDLSFEPIDNSDVEVEDGNKIYLHPINVEDPKLQRIVPMFNTSINEIEKTVGTILGNEKIEKARYLIDGVFKTGFDTVLYVSNRSFPRRDGSISKKIAIRTPRVSGDWLDTEIKLPVSKTLIFEGSTYNRGKEFSIDKIIINAESSERLPYEVECNVRICDNSVEIRKPFLDDIINQSTSIYEHTARQLTLWEDYLDWSKKVAEHQIKGCKYIDVDYDSDRQRLIFTLIADSKEEFNKVRKSLRRDVQAYRNNYSSNEWKFEYNNEARGYGEPIGLCDKNVVEEFFLYGNENKVFGYRDFNDNDKDVITMNDLTAHYAEKNPYIVKMSYDLSADDKDYIQEQNLEDNELEDFVLKEVLPKYPRSGFLALSAVGDFSLIWRFNNAISQLKNGENYSPRLAEWIFDSKFARLPEVNQNSDSLTWSNKRIESNRYQKEAVEKMLSAPDLFLLQGPPGTGKTTVIAEAIYQFVKQGKRVLLSSQSNDAVDNALERLANTPEIRALRIGGKRKKTKSADEELALNKFSEETALKYYYKSISSQISERMLDKWKGYEEKDNELRSDKRDLRNFNQDISDLQNTRGSKLREQTSLQIEYGKAKKALEDFNKKTSDIQNENIQYNNFLAVLYQSSEMTFSFSKEQIRLIADEINSLANSISTKGIKIFTLKNPISEENIVESNRQLFSLSFNRGTLNNLRDKLYKDLNTPKTSTSPELLVLEKKISELEERLAVCPDDEYDALEREQNNLKRQRKLLANNSNSSLQLSSVEKSLLNDENLNLAYKNTAYLISTLDIVIEEIEQSIESIKVRLEKRIDENNKSFDSTKLNNDVDALEGKIRNCTTEIHDIDKEISSKKDTVITLCKKYELEENSTVDFIENRINDLINSNTKQAEAAKEIKKYWGSVLENFKDKLDKHSSDERLIEIDNDNYFKSIYVKACNVVGISCTANPKILAEKDYTDFDVVIIDEVSKATPPELLIPLMKARKTVLVGDHRQLPPMFKENVGSYGEFVEEVQNGEDYDDDLREVVTMENFSKYRNMVTASLFKTHFENAPESLKASLLIQFRMHPDIMNIINRFYEGKLECGIPKEDVETEKAHDLRIPAIRNTDFIVPKKHAYWIDSSKLPNGVEVEEVHKGTSTSSCNFLEEDMAIELLKKIAATYKAKGYPKEYIDKSGDKRKETVSVGIISFYQMQVNDIRRKVKNLRKQADLSAIDIDVNTVDRFQGKEKQIIIVSLVRNKKYDPARGLKVSDHVLSFERINVAFSRAQNMLVILGAKNFYKEIAVKLPMMTSNGTMTVHVYQNIMQDLQDKGCFFDSSVLIDDKASERILSEIKSSKEDGNSVFTKRNNNFKRGRK